MSPQTRRPLIIALLSLFSDIHKHFAISFRSPKYADPTLVQQPRPVQVQLRRPSDGQCSESLPFFLLPVRGQSERHKQRRSAQPQSVSPLTANQPLAAIQSDQLPLEGDKIDFFSLDYYMTSATNDVMDDMSVQWTDEALTAGDDPTCHLLDISNANASAGNCWSRLL